LKPLPTFATLERWVGYSISRLTHLAFGGHLSSSGFVNFPLALTR
jgi:hypothetical protein